MKTLILPPRYTQDSISLWGVANTNGWKVERLQSWRVPETLSDCDVAIYGEPFFAALVAQELHLSLLEPPFHWLSELPEIYRKRDILFTTLGEARKYASKAFIKPADDKCFPAQVYETGKKLPAYETLAESTPVLISEPVNWQIEFRCFVLDRKVRTLSPYWRNGELAQNASGEWYASESEITEALNFAEGLLSDSSVRVPPSVVIDIGIIEGRGWAVVEANPAWASGIYGCDPQEVLSVIARAFLKTNQVSEEDKGWVVERRD